MTAHEQLEQENRTRLMDNWRNEIVIPDKYNAYKKKFLQLLSDFEERWEGQLSCIKTAKHGIKLKTNVISLVHSSRYYTWPTAIQFVAKEIQ